MGKTRMPRISLCMIVKNEEQKLKRALSWGAGVLWEKIVVDTGSTDGTVALAETLGAKVYHFDWIDDFAAARNFALEQAKGDWILTQDADEWPVPETPDKLCSIVRQADERGADGVFGGILELDDKGEAATCSSRIRIFRNRPGIRYRRRVHEQLEFVDGHSMQLADAEKELLFFHDGYVGENFAGKQRSKRNLKLLEQELAEHPDDYEVMGYLGDEYSGYGEKEQALAWYQKSVEHMPEVLREGDPRSAWTFSALIALYGEKGEFLEAEKIYRLAVGKQPEEADYDYQMGCLCVAEKRWEDGIRYLAGGITKLEQHGTANSCMRIKAALEEVYGNLALCFLRSGRRKDAVETSVALLKAKLFDMKALYILLSAFYEDGGKRADESAYVNSVVGFLKKLYPLPDLKSRLFIARAAEKAGWEAMKAQMEVPGR